jgi:hypothetical protein
LDLLVSAFPLVGAPTKSPIKKSVLGPWQFEIVAQRLAFVFATENSAPLQFRHHAVDEIIKPSWEIWKLSCSYI